MSTHLNVTLKSATAVFGDWESDYRADPASFMTTEEVAAMAIASVSEARAIYFLALLKQYSKCPDCRGSGRYRKPYTSDFVVCSCKIGGVA